MWAAEVSPSSMEKNSEIQRAPLTYPRWRSRRQLSSLCLHSDLPIPAWPLSVPSELQTRRVQSRRGSAGSLHVTLRVLRSQELVGPFQCPPSCRQMGVMIPLWEVTGGEGASGGKRFADGDRARSPPHTMHMCTHLHCTHTHLCVLDLDGSLGDCLGDHLTLGGYHGNRLV